MSTTSSGRFEKHITIEDAPSSVVELLSSNTGMSRQKIKQVMQQGAVWLTRRGKTKRIRRAKHVANKGDTLHLYYDAAILSQVPPTPELIADEQTYSIWNKPYGMFSQGSKWSDHCTINRWVEQHLQPARPCLIVHRLDRAANGLMLLAHSKATAKYFTQLFEARQIEKRYRIKVHGQFPQDPAIATVTEEIDGKAACSHFLCLSYDAVNDYSVVEVKIDTGRKHQIRKHAASLGYPVVGDRLYGKAEDESDRNNLQLQAFSLAFNCPLSQQDKTFYLPKQYHLG